MGDEREMITIPDEITGNSIGLSIEVDGVMTPVNEKLTADLNINDGEIQIEPTFDSGSWADYLKGTKDGAIPLTMYFRTGSLVYRTLRDAAANNTPLPYEYATPNETYEGSCEVMGWSLGQTSANQVVQVTTSLRFKGEPTITDLIPPPVVTP